MRVVRSLFALVVLVCLSVMGLAYYVQYHDGLLPCTLCIMQRGAYVLTGLMALIGLVCPYRRRGYRLWAFLGGFFATLGSVLAARQVWLQHQPLDPNAPCVPGMGYLFQAFSFPRALNMALHGSTDCGQINWTLFSFSMAEWSFVCFAGLAVLMFFLLIFRTKSHH